MTASKPVTTPTKVVFQKIVKPPSNVPPALFLAQLVQYIQDDFEIPANLPMVYEKQQEHGGQQEYVVSFDSPLSSSCSDTRLDIQVVAIYTQDDNDKENNKSLPDMAMVVVKKDDSHSTNQNVPMMQGLFQESEKQLLRALERGLDDVQQGKIAFTEKPDSVENIPTNVKSVQEAIEAEIVSEHKKESTDSNMTRETNNNNDVVLDTTATSITDEPKPITKSSSSPINEDFAVAAAKRIAAKLDNESKAPAGGGDYAVEQAAKRASAAASDTVADKPKSKPTAKRNPKRFTISTPKQRAERVAKKLARKKSSTVASTSKSSESKKEAKKKPNVSTASKEVTVKDKAQKFVNNTRSLNLSVEDENGDVSIVEQDKPLEFETMVSDGSNDTNERTLPREQMERDVLEAAQKAMSEIEDVEMTPEELLQDVMKFGEEKEQENAAGTGFVSGAFEKAKELLREQKQQREERLKQQQVGVKERAKPSTNGEPLSAEEELKRIFEAGERLADGRIEISKSDPCGESTMMEQEIEEQQELDSLIAGEKTISNYARSLDDELAELEVRINKSPGEELDGPPRNPQFDIFSGPEVYNPNVDPETAVNWPGAQPGTKTVRLPKELDEAVKQAKFAAQVLVKMKQVDGDHDTTKFFVGKRELTQQQAENIRTVVTEAVEIGLIDDPLEYLAEQSRMQMVVDEMRGRPEERYRDIVSNFRDLLLSDNFVPLIKDRLEQMADRDLDAKRQGGDDTLEGQHAEERTILGHLVEYAQLLLKEARALGAELEASQLEIVRSICQVAMDPSHKTEEDTATALTDAVRDMRPLLDDVFVAYLKYAIAEEEGRLARAGLLDDPDHNEWLFVLKIVQQGVYTELARGISRYVEHIGYVLRMETKAERRMLLSKIIDNMPTMDVRPFVQVVDKIVSSLGESARGEFDGAYTLGEMSNKILQLRRDVKELLPPERIQLMSRDADEWAEKQKQRLLERRKITKQRLKAAAEYDDDEIQRRGEIERM